MKTETFTYQLNFITKLLLGMTPAQRATVQRTIQTSEPEIAINELIQPIFQTAPQCPYCHSTDFNKWGKAGSIQRYCCKECNKTFNNKTKTPLARLHKCELWELYTQCMALKLTLREAADICNINLKTSFLWRHRFLMSQSEHHNDKLSGIIEVDEFFMLHSEKGSRKLQSNRNPRHRGREISKQSEEGKVTVLLSIDRSKHFFTQVLANDTKSEIKKYLEPYITKNSILCSDGAYAYTEVAKDRNCIHKRLLTREKEKVQEGVYHIQTVNGAIANFKGWINSKMKGVATKYLHHYLAWFRESSKKLDNKQILTAAYR